MIGYAPRPLRRIVPPLLLLLLATVLGAGCAKKVAQGPLGGPPAAGAGARVIEHRVAAGETLARIADHYYGDPGRAAQIAGDNGIADPARILPGSLLRLRFADGEWEAARRRASALAAYNRGVDELARERLAEAEKQFRQAVATAPELQDAGYNLALVLIKRGRHDEALALLETATEARPRDADFRFARGHVLFLLTRFDEASAQFRLVLESDPGHQRALFGLARSLQEAGRKSAARAAWLRYLEVDGTSSWAEDARRSLRQLDDDGSR